MSDSNKPEQQHAGQFLGIYFVGKLKARLSESEIEALVKAELPYVSTHLQEETKSCAAELGATGRQLKDISQHLKSTLGR